MILGVFVRCTSQGHPHYLHIQVLNAPKALTFFFPSLLMRIVSPEGRNKPWTWELLCTVRCEDKDLWQSDTLLTDEWHAYCSLRNHLGSKGVSTETSLIYLLSFLFKFIIPINFFSSLINLIPEFLCDNWEKKTFAQQFLVLFWVFAYLPTTLFSLVSAFFKPALRTATE